ncbi:CRISPR-associated endonuclease Cas2 [Caldimonas tepidiphila]|uniref:CRISPR-associated endonuclease Cas2 n=1 Tax=Caldimonas tepidiphila TaxID=2315841 RepID=UPI000E5A6618|nr:CRISPR-associated endonuclease Cas2 [Caldimonas tepidiphila]
MQRVLVSYDIGSPRRRAKAARLLCDHGVRVQESVYELALRAGEWTAVCRALDRLIDPVADQWRAWPLCAADRADAVQLGAASPAPIQGAVVV